MNKILLLILSLLIASCNQSENKQLNRDEFYTDKGGFDIARVPLIKPYEAVTISNNVNWMVRSIDTNSVPVPISGTKEVRVIDTIILIHSGNTLLDYQQVKEGWFVIIPKSHLIKGFKTHQEYLEYIKHIGLKEEPRLFDIGSVWHYFDDQDYINWKQLR